jgi:hypothetical protein
MVQLLRFRDIICIGEKESMGTPTASSNYIFFSHSFIDEKHTMIPRENFFFIIICYNINTRRYEQYIAKNVLVQAMSRDNYSR